MKENTCKLHSNSILPSSIFLLILSFCLIQCTDNDKGIEEVQTENLEHEILDIQLATDASTVDLTQSDKKSSSRRTLNTINAALQCSGFKQTLFSGVKTIFAPTDEAFKQLGLDETNICDKIDVQTLNSILKYHVIESHIERYDRGCLKMLDGNTAFINTVQRFKMAINNHEVSTIYNQSRYNYNLNVFMTSSVLKPPIGTILQTINADKELAYLSEIIDAYPELKSALSDESSTVTLFAPTDRSIRDLLIRTGSGTISSLIENVGSDILKQIIAYHVVNDCVYISGLSNREKLTSVQGGEFELNSFKDGIIDETEQVSRFSDNNQDILASNGIIHKIKRVMSPSLDISDAGLNTRRTNDDVSSVKASILNTFGSIEAIGVAAEISHSTNAANVGLDLNPTELLLFGNPRLGTPIMQANQKAGIDLPQKFLIYEDNEGVTRLAYNDISYLKARHGLGDNIPTLDVMTNALNNFASAQSVRMAGPIAQLPEQGEGLITTISDRSFSYAYLTIKEMIDNNPNLKLISEIDHQANAARVGLDLEPTTLLIFGNPNLGTPLMQNSQTVAIDLPQKILIWENEYGEAHITYNDPFYLKSRHSISENDEILSRIRGALSALALAGAGL